MRSDFTVLYTFRAADVLKGWWAVPTLQIYCGSDLRIAIPNRLLP